MICGDNGCGCALQTTTLDLSGSGTPEDPWILEQIELASLADIENDIAAILALLDGLASTYLAKAGGEMSGPLIVRATGAGIQIIRTDSETPHLEFLTQAGVSIGYVQGDDVNDLVSLIGRAGYAARIGTNGVEAARWLTNGIYLIGKTASNIATAGAELHPGGSSQVSRSAAGFNFGSNKTSAADANGEEHFRVMSAGTTIGSITRATASTTAFNTSSDEDLKQNIRYIDDALALYWLRIVQPTLFEFIISPEATQGGYVAQRVAAAWPESVSLGIVTPGHGDINARTWDEEGNETTPDDTWRGWQIDLSKFVPFIHAGVQAVDVRVSILEDLVGSHVTQIAALETEVADLRDDLTALQATVIALSGG
jgi:hypothetical protein